VPGGYLVDDAHQLAAGPPLDPDVVAALFAGRRHDDPIERLRPREREVLGLMAEGRSNAGMRRLS